MAQDSQIVGPLKIALATDQDRETIYKLRHDVYSRELAQYPENQQGKLSDSLDRYNIYITAKLAGEVVGFISVTPPWGPSFSIDKYLNRSELPFPCNDTLYELRLLTVLPRYRRGERGAEITGLLIYAAVRWVESRGGTRFVAIGRREVLGLYLRIGMELLGRQIQSGAVTFELLTATLDVMRKQRARYQALLEYVKPGIDWELDVPFDPTAVCFHGGAFFQAVGDEFDRLDEHSAIINADVLDAWFPPSPKVLAAVQDYLPWLLRTSPPAGCEGMIRTIARVRGIRPENILPGSGSSSLIFLALGHWLKASSRTLILDPAYGEYAHLLEQVIHCRVDRLHLARIDGYALDLARLEASFDRRYDFIVLINPNSPTGRHIPREDLESFLSRAPKETRFWIDETYVEYAGPDQSLEMIAARSENVVVCKSMSKVYALSGARAAYVCGPPHLIADLRKITPPWAVGLPAQVAAVRALQDPEYYGRRWQETHALRKRLVSRLTSLTGMEVVPSVANFVLCHLPSRGPDAATVVARCRKRGLFLRNAATMGSQMGTHVIRVAVKDEETNSRIAEILAEESREWE